jgi:hypothetical protein
MYYVEHFGVVYQAADGEVEIKLCDAARNTVSGRPKARFMGWTIFAVEGLCSGQVMRRVGLETICERLLA